MVPMGTLETRWSFVVYPMLRLIVFTGTTVSHWIPTRVVKNGRIAIVNCCRVRLTECFPHCFSYRPVTSPGSVNAHLWCCVVHFDTRL